MDDTFEKFSSSDHKINLKDLQLIVKELSLGICAGDVRALFIHYNKKGEEAISYDVILEDIMKLVVADESFNGSLSPKKKLVRLTNENQDGYVLSQRCRDDIGDSVRGYLESSTEACIGKLFLHHAELRSGSLSTITRKQMRRAFAALGAQLTDSDEISLFECLDVKNDGNISIYDLVLFCLDLALMNDNLEACQSIKRILDKKKTQPKEYARTLNKLTTKKSGYLDDVVYQKFLAKIYDMKENVAKFEEIEDVIRFLDPKKEGRVDIEYAAALGLICTDYNRATMKLKNMLRVLRTKNIDYKSILVTNLDERILDGQISSDELSSAFQLFFALPILPCEVYLVISRYHKRNKINIESFLEKVESASNESIVDQLDPLSRLTSTASKLSHGSSQNNDFGKILLKKLFKLRSNLEKRLLFRASVISKDADLNGYVTKRDLQRLFDSNQYLDLTDEESSLLVENFTCHGTFSGEIDYSQLLLILNEPVPNQAQVASLGLSLIKKVCRDDDVNLFFEKLLQMFSSNDSSHSGFVPLKQAIKIVTNLFQVSDIKAIKSILLAFTDFKSDCCLYFEFLSFIKCCSIWYVMNRLNHIEKIRQMQGYNFQEFIMRTKLIDQQRFIELLTSLGILIPNIAVNTVFMMLGSKGNHSMLDTNRFVISLNDSSDEKTRERIRQHDTEFTVSPYENDELHDDGVKDILRQYDSKLQLSLQRVFDAFDVNHNNEIPTVELERVMHSLGYTCYLDDLVDLCSKLDPRQTGVMEYNSFMTHAMTFLRAQYHDFTVTNLERLKLCFDALDQNGDEALDQWEFRHVVDSATFGGHITELTLEEIDALINYLDLDNDGVITWVEFRQIFGLMTDREMFPTLNVDLQRAIRKVFPRTVVELHITFWSKFLLRSLPQTLFFL